MSDPTTPSSPVPQYSAADRYVPGRGAMQGREPAGLADVLDRILDKGLVIAGDISISLAQVELITIKIRLLLASADKAQQMGIDWWTRDPSLSSGAAGGGGEGGGGDGDDVDAEEEARALRQRVYELEQKLAGLMSGRESVASRSEPIGLPDILAMREQRTAPPAPRRPPRSSTDDAEEEEAGVEEDRAEGDLADESGDTDGAREDERDEDRGDERGEDAGDGAEGEGDRDDDRGGDG